MDLKQIKNLELIENYLSGNLSKEESMRFLSSLETDEELAKEFFFVKNMQTALSENRAETFKDKFRTWDAEKKEEIAPEAKKVILSPWKKYIAIAASAAVLIFFSWNLNLSSKIDTLAVFEANFTAYPTEITRNSKNNTNEAYLLYANKEYEKAILKFENLANESTFFFLGNSYLATNEPLKAISALNNYNGQKYALASQWYLALAHLQNDDIPAAKLVLEKLKLQKGAYGKKAISLLKTI